MTNYMDHHMENGHKVECECVYCLAGRNGHPAYAETQREARQTLDQRQPTETVQRVSPIPAEAYLKANPVLNKYLENTKPSVTPPVNNKDHKPNVYYLASPYSHKQKDVMEQRYLNVVRTAALLTTEFLYCLIEPIGMGHPMSKVHEMPTGYEYWKRRDRAFIDASAGVIVAAMDGWLHSEGVTDEIDYALSLNKPVYILLPNLTPRKAHFILLDENTAGLLSLIRKQSYTGT